MSNAITPEDRHPEPVGRPLLVLIGDDGSQEAAASTAIGLRIAGRTHGTAMLLHAEGDPAEHDRWERHLVNAADYAPVHAATRTILQRGDPAEVILRVAETEGADLICVGAAGVDRGGVSSAVVERAPCPVLVCRQGVEISPSRISAVVVAVDRSEIMPAAMHLAELLAEVFDATVVAPVPPTPELREWQADSAASDEAVTRGEADQTLVDAVQRHAPAILILDGADVDSSTGQLRRRTRRMLATAPCPVLVIPRRREPGPAARPADVPAAAESTAESLPSPWKMPAGSVRSSASTGQGRGSTSTSSTWACRSSSSTAVATRRRTSPTTTEP
ncbi:universal stress protein [Baekduia soli]|nr:universal stress protein [Baekduia soli]